jgi:RNA polymerase sigma-70 factor (ECF subfamily)
MPDTSESRITQLLDSWSTGDVKAAERVLPLVYDELRRIALRQLRYERKDHTLQATAIVHEAYLRLSGQEGFHWPDRAHFYAFAAHLIRRILVDYARRRNRDKREGKWEKVALTEVADLLVASSPDVETLDDALVSLESLDPRKAAVVELRFFGGLTLDETAKQLGISTETVSREWRRAKAFLTKELRGRER